MESHKCPLTHQIFEDPVIGDDGHTYERKAIEDWIGRHGTSPATHKSMDISRLITNHTIKKIIDEFKSSARTQHNFQLDVDIRKTTTRPLFQNLGKKIYKVEWINRPGPAVVLLKIDGAKANQEASFYVQLSCHPHIVRTYEFVQNSDQRSVMLLQECAPLGDLSELLRENEFHPDEHVLLKIFEQICDAMICLTANDIVHGDLACRNLLVFQLDDHEPKKNLVRLTDFGLTRGSKLYSLVPTPAVTVMTIIPTRYAAPEILEDTTGLNYSEKSDVYSMGVLMWEACSYGALPYSYLDNDEEVRQMKLNDGRLPRPSLCSDDLWNMMNECWHQDPQNRPDFQSLKHSILTLEFQRIPQTKTRTQEEPARPTFAHSPIIMKKYISHNHINEILSSDSMQKVDGSTPVNRAETAFVDDCEGEHTGQSNLCQQKTATCHERTISCPFCNEVFASPDTMRDHLSICGNKREPCPNCAHLCGSQYSCQTSPNKNADEEIKPTMNWSANLSGRKAKMVKCDNCHKEFSQKDYISHQDTCSKNRFGSRLSFRERRVEPSVNNQHDSADSAHVTCASCNESVSLLQILSHKRVCPKRK